MLCFIWKKNPLVNSLFINIFTEISLDNFTAFLIFVQIRIQSKKMIFNFKKNRAWAENLTIVMQLGLTMAGCIVFMFFVGRYLDRWLGTRGIFISLFTILGVIGGANVTYRQIMEITADKSHKNKEKNHLENGND